MAFFNKRWMLVERVREKALVDFFETVKLTTLGRNPAYFESLLEHARKHAIASIEGILTLIHNSNPPPSPSSPNLDSNPNPNPEDRTADNHDHQPHMSNPNPNPKYRLTLNPKIVILTLTILIANPT